MVTYIHITEAKLHDMNAMGEKYYEPNAFYIFDKRDYDLARLYKSNISAPCSLLELRRIVYYAPELKSRFTFLTNDLTIKSKIITMLYKQRWQVELFFRWIKQHLRRLSFRGTSENAVIIQVSVAVITYILVTIVEHDY